MNGYSPTALADSDLDQVNGGFSILGVDIGFSGGNITATVNGYGVGVGLGGPSLQKPGKNGPQTVGQCHAD